jgi:hypothetical protein
MCRRDKGKNWEGRGRLLQLIVVILHLQNGKGNERVRRELAKMDKGDDGLVEVLGEYTDERIRERIGRSPITRVRPASSQWCWQRGQEGGVGRTQALLPKNTGRRMSGGGHVAEGCSAAYSSLSM